MDKNASKVRLEPTAADEQLVAPKPKRKTVKQVDAEQNADSVRIDALEQKVQELHDMVVFLNENPAYRAVDYLSERGR